MLNAVLPVLGTDRLNFQPFEIGLLFSVINAIGIGAVLLGGTFGDRFGRYRMLVPALGVLALALALLFTIQNQVTYVLLGCFKAPRASSIHCRPSSWATHSRRGCGPAASRFTAPCATWRCCLRRRRWASP